MPGSEQLVFFRRAPSGLCRPALQRFGEALCRRVTGRRAFHCLITDDRELRRLNARFLGRNYATDVLSFPDGAGPLLGEIAISGQRARAQAREYGHSADEEIQILMLHGALHLLGMDHERDRGRMARSETLWRRKLGLPRGLIERVRA